MKKLFIFFTMTNLLIFTELSNSAPAPCTITSYCNAAIKSKDKAMKKRLVANCVEYIRYGFDSDWYWEEDINAPPYNKSKLGRDGSKGDSYKGGVGGKGGKAGRGTGGGSGGAGGAGGYGGVGGKGGAGGSTD